MDCAGSPVHRLSLAGIDTDKITAVVITHGHTDHLYGLPSLLHGMVMQKRIFPLEIYCPPGIKRQIEGLMDVFSLPRKTDFRINIEEIPSSEEFCVRSGLRLQSLSAFHNTQAMGIAFFYDNKKVVYSGDTSPGEELIRIAEKCDVLIHECNYFDRSSKDHTSLLDIRRIVSQAKPRRVILVHFDTLEDFSRWKEVLGGSGDNIQLGYDFMEIEV